MPRNSKRFSNFRCVGQIQPTFNGTRPLAADSEILLAKSKIDERAVVKESLMPEGQEQQLSREAFADLIADLFSMK